MKPATIQKITKIEPHPNKEIHSLEIARVLGWNCIVKKNEFKEGDLVVYIQIDSIVPKTPQFEFLKKTSYRVRTMKFRGVVSQGVLLPISVLPNYHKMDFECYQGDDVSETLGIKHYEKPMPLGGDSAGSFPTHIISKTDEERIQNIPWAIDWLKDKEVYISKKHDGTSFTFIQGEEPIVCSRNLKKKDGENVYWEMVRKYNLLNTIPKGFSIQGEIIGPGIQKNQEGIKEQELRVFNVQSPENKFLPYHEFKRFCTDNKIPTVEEVYVGKFKWESVEELLDFSDTIRYNNGRQAEGIVIRTTCNTSIDLSKPISFKVISNKYALKHGE